MSEFKILLNNKEGKQFAVFMSIVMFLLIFLLLKSGANVVSLISIIPPLLVLSYMLFYTFKTLKVKDDQLIIEYHFRLFNRTKALSIAEIQKVVFNIQNSGLAYSYIGIYTTSKYFYYEFRVSNIEFEECILLLAKKGRFNLISRNKAYGYVKELLKDVNQKGQVIFGKTNKD